MLSQVHSKRASDAWREIECPIDPGAAINDRTIDPALGRGAIGEPAAGAEAKCPDFAGAFAPSAQLGYRGGDVRDPNLLDLRFGAEHDIALGGVEIGDRLPIPI